MVWLEVGDWVSPIDQIALDNLNLLHECRPRTLGLRKTAIMFSNRAIGDSECLAMVLG